MKGSPSLQRYPWVFLAPEDLYRAADILEHRLDLGCEFFIGLRELPIEADSSILGEPRLRQLLEVVWIDLGHDRTVNVRLDHGFVDVRRQTKKGVGMAADVIEERRSPRPHRDGVHQDVSIEIASMQEMGPQGRCPAEVEMLLSGTTDDDRSYTLSVGVGFF
jgi:hypothetical protein